jgi:hypothetical protein
MAFSRSENKPVTSTAVSASTLIATQRSGPAAKAAVPALTEKTRDENRIVSESARSALREIAPHLKAESCGNGR